MGIIKSTVLHYKNGVITEERFQKMTPAQWHFHYLEILRYQQVDNDKLKIITNYMELVGTMANPKAGKVLQEIKELEKSRKEIDANKFAEYFEDLKKVIPNKIMVKRKNPVNKILLPLYDKKSAGKKLGITIGDEGGDYGGAR